jgi:competence protein ComEA
MSGIETNRAVSAAVILALLVVGAGGAGVVAATPSKSADDSVPTPIDLNRATVEELETVPGIGAVMAQRIVDFREQHGRFGRVDDLLKVRGIGEKSLEKLRPYFEVSSKN